jgi:hypothetical protein
MKLNDPLLNSALYDRFLSSSSPGLFYYASKSRIADVVWGLRFVHVLIIALGELIAPWIAPLLDLVNHWLSCELDIYPIKIAVWKFLPKVALICAKSSPESTVPFLTFVIDHVIQFKAGIAPSYEFWLAMGASQLRKVIRLVLRTDGERLTALLVRAVEGIQAEVQRAAATVAMMTRCGTAPDDSHEQFADLEEIRRMWMEVIEGLLRLAPPILLPFFTKTIVPQFEAAMDQPDTLGSGMDILTFYYRIGGGNLENALRFIERLLGVVGQPIPGVSVCAFLHLLELFTALPLTPQMVIEYLERLRRFIDNLNKIAPENRSIDDGIRACALGATQG